MPDTVSDCIEHLTLFMYLFGFAMSLLQHMGSSVFMEACRIFSCGMWHLAP